MIETEELNSSRVQNQAEASLLKQAQQPILDVEPTKKVESDHNIPDIMIDKSDPPVSRRSIDNKK